MRLLLQFSLLLLVTTAFASGSKIVEGKLESAPEGDNWVLRIGTDAVPVALEGRTKFWAKKSAVDAKAFKAGDSVFARIAADQTPAALRELSDRESWDWLEKIRKGVREGTMKSFDGKRIVIAFSDGTEMGYRATEKSKITLDGKVVTLGDLKVGQKLWAKGRTLPTLDVWLVAASDQAIANPAPKTSSKRGSKSTTVPDRPRKMPASGTFKAEIALHSQGLNMFDVILDGVRMHVSYFSSTAFTFGGTKCGANELVPGREVTVTYRRDQYGRIGAAKVAIR